MKNVFNQLFDLYCEIFNSLESWEKAIFIFWSVCFVTFIYAYIRGVIAITQHYINLRKSKPQKF